MNYILHVSWESGALRAELFDEVITFLASQVEDVNRIWLVAFHSHILMHAMHMKQIIEL